MLTFSITAAANRFGSAHLAYRTLIVQTVFPPLRKIAIFYNSLYINYKILSIQEYATNLQQKYPKMLRLFSKELFGLPKPDYGNANVKSVFFTMDI